MLFAVVVLWILVGVVTSVLGIQSPRLLLVCAISLAAFGAGIGGYISARYITPKSFPHTIVAAVLIGVIYEHIFTSGDIGALEPSILIGAASFAALGVGVARRIASHKAA
jgi:hypothetical protein